MVYLEKFSIPNLEQEEGYLNYCDFVLYNNCYPFRILSNREFEEIKFNDITIFYGGNGSGKSTLLNSIAEKLEANRIQNVRLNSFFDDYVRMCSCKMSIDKPLDIRIITSDDVFDYLNSIKILNGRIDRKRESLFDEYISNKNKELNINDYDSFKDIYDAKRGSRNNFVRNRLTKNNIIEQSNGESALMFFESEIKEDAIYLLDEPENSLSAQSQLELVKFISDSVRFYNCQFIISTHSPFLLSIADAKIYDIDSNPVCTRKWTDLKNVRLYYDFIKKHEKDFE